jgi:hypothetical protein
MKTPLTCKRIASMSSGPPMSKSTFSLLRLLPDATEEEEADEAEFVESLEVVRRHRTSLLVLCALIVVRGGCSGINCSHHLMNSALLAQQPQPPNGRKLNLWCCSRCSRLLQLQQQQWQQASKPAAHSRRMHVDCANSVV